MASLKSSGDLAPFLIGARDRGSDSWAESRVRFLARREWINQSYFVAYAGAPAALGARRDDRVSHSIVPFIDYFARQLPPI
jgi:hypothetical protein